ncbi:MAG TPA: response regulator [Draconibacterium sp.]|nr:response regulator [Draconibacterium sp.]HRX10074.1 response regulator [Draconibacterium sp.]
MELNWKNKTIVIVDDTKLNFVLLKTILRKTEANIVWLENGQEVIDYVKNLNAVDLILMDIRMPVIDGIEASKIIKNIAPQIPIIIQTASVMGEAFEDIKNSGCDDTIFKPIDSGKLIIKIQKQLEKK